MQFYEEQDKVALGEADVQVLRELTTSFGQERVFVEYYNPSSYTVTGSLRVTMIGSEQVSDDEVLVQVCTDAADVRVFGADGTEYSEPETELLNDVTVLLHEGQWLVHESTNHVADCSSGG